MQNELQSLIDDYGNEKVIEAAKQLLDQEQNKRAGQYHELVAPDKITDDLHLLHEAIKDISAAGQVVDDAYANRNTLTKQIALIKTNIDLDEAEAFMQLEGNKVQIDGKTVTLSNDKMRDMYRKYVTRDARYQLAELEADLKAIEIDIYKAKDQWEEAKTAAELIKARTHVQANLLRFLS